MAFGGLLGILGVPLPGTEILIAISAILLGLAVAIAARPPLWIAAALVGVFAIFHGHAHGTELPPGADAIAYSAGFVIATGLLHLAGIAFGLLVRWPAGLIAVRAVGGRDRVRRRGLPEPARGMKAVARALIALAARSLRRSPHWRIRRRSACAASGAACCIRCS